jgi:hypothetical protein
MRDSKLAARARVKVWTGLGLVLGAGFTGCDPPDYAPPDETVLADAAASSAAPLPAMQPGAAPPPSPAPPPPPPGPAVYDGLYSLSAKHSGKCLDVRASAGGYAQTFTCDASATQFFRLSATREDVYRLADLQSVSCLEVEAGSVADFAKLKLSRCDAARPEQGFRIEETTPGYVRLLVEKSAKCLDVYYSSTADGSTVQQFLCNGTAAQDWLLNRSFVLRPHELRAKHSDRCLDSPGLAAGTTLQQLTCNGSGSQTFRIQARGRGLFSIVRNQGGLCLDVKSSDLADGAPLQLWTCNGSTAQFFRFQPLGGGYDRIVNENSGKCLQVVGGRSDDGAVIEQSACTDAESQRWSAREK